MDLSYLPLFSFLSVTVLSVFSMASVAVYTSHRRREREAYYQSEVLKKLAEMQGTGAPAVLEVIRERERVMWRTVREGLKIGGVVTVAVGLGLLVFFRSLPDAPPVGFIPLFVGIALLVYSVFLAPKER